VWRAARVTRRAPIASAVSFPRTLPPVELGWTIDIDAVGDPADAGDNFDDLLDAFETALDPYSGAVAASDEHDRYGARFSLDTDSVDPVEILEQGLVVFHDAAIAAGLPAWQVVHCEILTYEEDEASESE
jgi:hypothetical protein